MNEAAPDAQLAQALRGHRVLVAYGLLGEVVAGLHFTGIDYMGAQADFLRTILHVPTEVVPVPTAATVSANAARLRAALQQDKAPAIIVAHSKGGVEALAALICPQAAAHCRALIAIQSPFFGSPVADALVARPPLRRAIGAAARALGGEIAGIDDLTTAVRTAWMQAHQAGVAAFMPRTLCCASFVEPAGAGPYRAGARWMQRRGAGPNDGLVPVTSALLPGARHLVLEGHHRALVSSGRKRDPAAVLRRLLTAALLPDILG